MCLWMDWFLFDYTCIIFLIFLIKLLNIILSIRFIPKQALNNLDFFFYENIVPGKTEAKGMDIKCGKKQRGGKYPQALRT